MPANTQSEPTLMAPVRIRVDREGENLLSLAKFVKQGARFGSKRCGAMFPRPARYSSVPSIAVAAAVAAATLALYSAAGAQVFVVGEKSATADVSTEFHPTRVQLPTAPITERGRRDLIRNLESEQGFAHRPLPLGENLTLMANGQMTPGGDLYKQVLYKKGAVRRARRARRDYRGASEE